MTVSDFYRILDTLYPRSLSCSWDNDGMMVCPDPETEVRRVLLSLDATEKAVAYAAENGCQLLLTHHPLLFRPLRALNGESLTGRRILASIGAHLTVVSLHTRLDSGDKGVNDMLAEALGLSVSGKFGDAEAPELGRLSVLAEPADAAAFADHVRVALGCDAVRLTGEHPVRCVALVGGDGKDMLHPAMLAGADTLVTGAASYNSALDAAEEGMNVIEAGHYHTEAPVLLRLAELCRTYTGAECLFFDSCRTRLLTARQ